MPFDLAKIRGELAGDALVAPLADALAAAVISDCWRLAGLRPIAAADWPRLRRMSAGFEEQAGVLAYLLGRGAMRDATVEALAASRAGMDGALASFFAAIEPLTAEMVHKNAFRQEELVRWWVRSVGGEIAGESAAQSEARLAKLDYKKTLVEYQSAEKARLAEAERRAKALAEAAEKEAEARGWRE